MKTLFHIEEDQAIPFKLQIEDLLNSEDLVEIIIKNFLIFEKWVGIEEI